MSELRIALHASTIALAVVVCGSGAARGAIVAPWSGEDRHLMPVASAGAPLDRREREDDRQRWERWLLEQVVASATCTPTASSVAFGNPGASAIVNDTAHIPECGLVRRVAEDPGFVLSTGPPFELLRPA